ncbi:hypothetical protein [Thiomicrorhabdus sp.]|uniref:hypothetical protein n=1 Tax=Thiomicrorhabdus sp. TaxID=2039724 RepID=UPI0029C887E1|nr:hypothetical protein [Thiomicrorhabdus sp.]
MSRQYKLSERRDSNNKKNENGFIFFNEVNSKHDLTHFEILHTGIDTLEQKYHGDFKSDVIDKLLFNVFDNGQFGTVKQLKDYPNEHHKINVLDSDLKLRLTRANGKESGYRYLLQNKAVGVFIFIGFILR